jgi:hypothetical protein
MGRRACTEPQCLYKGELYFYFYVVYYYLCIGSRHCNMEANQIRFVFDCVPILCLSHDVSIETCFCVLVKKQFDAAPSI